MSGWEADALCAQIGGDLWFPDNSRTAQVAKRICGACPVREECLRFAVESRISVGIWGGRSFGERERIRREAA